MFFFFFLRYIKILYNFMIGPVMKTTIQVVRSLCITSVQIADESTPRGSHPPYCRWWYDGWSVSSWSMFNPSSLADFQPLSIHLVNWSSVLMNSISQITPSWFDFRDFPNSTFNPKARIFNLYPFIPNSWNVFFHSNFFSTKDGNWTHWKPASFSQFTKIHEAYGGFLK